LAISTVADTWIHLSYVAHGSERNRALSIVKSRGTDHPNQVRELLLSDAGITLADVYVETADVLEEPLRALEDGVFVTPTLMRLSRSPVRIVGNLSDRGTVAQLLGLERRES
jgi:hypothetical protein